MPASPGIDFIQARRCAGFFIVEILHFIVNSGIFVGDHSSLAWHAGLLESHSEQQFIT